MQINEQMRKINIDMEDVYVNLPMKDIVQEVKVC